MQASVLSPGRAPGGSTGGDDAHVIGHAAAIGQHDVPVGDLQPLGRDAELLLHAEGLVTLGQQRQPRPLPVASQELLREGGLS